MTRAHRSIFILLCACTTAHPDATCDLAATAGDACEGAWTCPATSLPSSTATQYSETRCEGGIVRERTWSVPFGDRDAGPPVGMCDPEASPGATCTGDWACAEEIIEGSTGTHHYVLRCVDGMVVLEHWLDPPVVPDAGEVLADAGEADGGAVVVDGGLADGGVVPTCGPASCGARGCGRSPCGYPCGECTPGFYCGGGGSCIDGRATPPPGTFCYDAFNSPVVEGSQSFRICPSDPALLQPCTCGGGGASNWVSCGACIEVRLDLARGARCATAAQCGGGVPCEPFMHLCGETCSAPSPGCPSGTACGVPGDISGVCLPTCSTCGTGCDEWTTCRRAAGGNNVCAPSGIGWATSC